MSGSYIANSGARSELLIVIDYMMNECFNEKTALSQAKLIEYAKKNYNVVIRRDRIPDICKHLVDIQSRYPNKLPFVIEEKHLNHNIKYYISKGIVSDEVAAKIGNALIDDTRILGDEANKIIREFFLKGLGKRRGQAVIEKINKAGHDKPKFNTMIGLFNQFSAYADNHAVITFRLPSPYKLKTPSKALRLKLTKVKGMPFEGVVYKIEQRGNYKYDAVIYMPSDKSFFLMNISKITVDSSRRPNKKELKFEFIDDKYENVESWIKDYYYGLVGDKTTFEFKFVNSPELREYIEKSFRSYFHKPLELKEKARTVYGEDSGHKKPLLTLVDCYGSVTCNFSSFRKWYMDYNILRCVVIVSPAYANNELLSIFTKRLQNRIAKYGDPSYVVMGACLPSNE